MAEEDDASAPKSSIQKGTSDFFSRPHMQRLRDDLDRANTDPQRRAFILNAREATNSPRLKAIAEALRDGVSGQKLWADLRETQAGKAGRTSSQKRRGRPPRSPQQVEEENALVDEVLKLVAAGVDLRFAELTIAPKLRGSGTLESKVTRLRKLRTDRR